ncbi:MAG: type II toxin-antitoxin system HicB family antitoxin [Endomicrobiia bacterium]|nr:type II toxin-antitoxin system HicB family antitoxin [Endomicrobiia bacterium]
MSQYKVIIRKGEDGWFVANCPQLKGCWSQGHTIYEARRNIRHAIKEYLSVLDEITQSEKKEGVKVFEVAV